MAAEGGILRVGEGGRGEILSDPRELRREFLFSFFFGSSPSFLALRGDFKNRGSPGGEGEEIRC